MFIESSAKAGFNIKALFRKLATALPGTQHTYIKTYFSGGNMDILIIRNGDRSSARTTDFKL